MEKEIKGKWIQSCFPHVEVGAGSWLYGPQWLSSAGTFKQDKALHVNKGAYGSSLSYLPEVSKFRSKMLWRQFILFKPLEILKSVCSLHNNHINEGWVTSITNFEPMCSKQLHECCTIAKENIGCDGSTSQNTFIEKRQTVNVSIVVNAPVDSWV